MRIMCSLLLELSTIFKKSLKTSCTLLQVLQFISSYLLRRYCWMAMYLHSHLLCSNFRTTNFRQRYGSSFFCSLESYLFGPLLQLIATTS